MTLSLRDTIQEADCHIGAVHIHEILFLQVMDQIGVLGYLRIHLAADRVRGHAEWHSDITACVNLRILPRQRQAVYRNAGGCQRQAQIKTGGIKIGNLVFGWDLYLNAAGQ